MSFLALGINHKTAPVELREQIAFAPESLVQVLQQLKTSLVLDEVAIVSTCNRTELYCVAETINERALLDWLSDHQSLSLVQLQQSSYLHRDDDGVKHVMRVASGLDSMVLGEPQILGQIKSAYAVARSAHSLGWYLEKLFQSTFAVAKQVRTETAIGQSPVSVAYAAVSLAQHIFADMSKTSALLIGAGKTVDLVARHLRQNGVSRMVVANRTLDRARELAESFNARAVLLSEVPECLVDADIVIASTASQLPILGKGAVERALKSRRHRPIYMVDIAVPRDIEPEVGNLADVYLYSVDDLQQVIQENLKSREDAAQEAQQLIDIGAGNLARELRELNAVSTLTAYRNKADALRDAELAKAIRQLGNGQSAESVMEYFARSLTNKLIHAPSIQLKKASSEGRTEILEVARELFELGPMEPGGKNRE